MRSYVGEPELLAIRRDNSCPSRAIVKLTLAMPLFRLRLVHVMHLLIFVRKPPKQDFPPALAPTLSGLAGSEEASLRGRKSAEADGSFGCPDDDEFSTISNRPAAAPVVLADIEAAWVETAAGASLSKL